ncbi:MAG: hypothetical protein LBL62_05770, partial [Planctomycetaceae bacterium]|nr:hypothetical protein [Planctomycetaceae bacterium]
QHFFKGSGFHPVLPFKNNRLGIQCLIFLSHIISVAVLWLLNKSITFRFGVNNKPTGATAQWADRPPLTNELPTINGRFSH